MHVYGNMQDHYAKLCKSNMLCMTVVQVYVVPSSLFLSFMRYYEYVSDRMTLGFWGKLKIHENIRFGNLPIKLGLPLGNLPIKLGLPK